MVRRCQGCQSRRHRLGWGLWLGGCDVIVNDGIARWYGISSLGRSGIRVRVVVARFEILDVKVGVVQLIGCCVQGIEELSSCQHTEEP